MGPKRRRAAALQRTTLLVLPVQTVNGEKSKLKLVNGETACIFILSMLVGGGYSELKPTQFRIQAEGIQLFGVRRRTGGLQSVHIYLRIRIMILTW
jgi:hypothetical protein